MAKKEKTSIPVPPMPVIRFGPKSKYNKKLHVPLVLKLGRKGASEARMALDCGISHRQFREWQKKYPELKEAVQEALTAAQVFWEERWSVMMDVPGHNANAYKHMLGSRFRDTYGERVTVAGDDEAPLTVITRRIVKAEP